MKLAGLYDFLDKIPKKKTKKSLKKSTFILSVASLPHITRITLRYIVFLYPSLAFSLSPPLPLDDLNAM